MLRIQAGICSKFIQQNDDSGTIDELPFSALSVCYNMRISKFETEILFALAREHEDTKKNEITNCFTK
jgi:hypothetical protein